MAAHSFNRTKNSEAGGTCVLFGWLYFQIEMLASKVRQRMTEKDILQNVDIWLPHAHMCGDRYK